jgi:hypothetical protein
VPHHSKLISLATLISLHLAWEIVQVRTKARHPQSFIQNVLLSFETIISAKERTLLFRVFYQTQQIESRGARRMNWPVSGQAKK